MRKFLALSVLLLSGVVVGVWLLDKSGDRTGATAERQDLAAGEQLYQDYCAACHGANLEGQPDWQSPGSDGVLPAPPHDETGHTWHHPDSVLFDYTRLGGQATLAAQGIDFASGMPGFGDQITDDQIRNILAYIKSTWPERERRIQAERSAVEREVDGD